MKMTSSNTDKGVERVLSPCKSNANASVGEEAAIPCVPGPDREGAHLILAGRDVVLTATPAPTAAHRHRMTTALFLHGDSGRAMEDSTAI